MIEIDKFVTLRTHIGGESRLIRFWGQPKFDPANATIVGYELFLREQSLPGSHWRVPADFSYFTPKTVIEMLAGTLNTLPKDLRVVSFNLDQEQFIDPTYRRLITDLKSSISYQLVVELTERVGKGSRNVCQKDLVDAARSLADADVWVCIDDIGTGKNQLALVEALDPYVAEYKYALQNVRGKLDSGTIDVQISTWHKRAIEHGKVFVIEGFEEVDDIRFIEHFHPDIVQGYFYGRPHNIPVAADF